MPQGFSRQRMSHVIHMVHDFGAGIAYTNLVVHNGCIYVKVHVLVDSHSEDEPSMLVIEGREVCATAAQSNPKRSSGENHVCSGFRFLTSTMLRVWIVMPYSIAV